MRRRMNLTLTLSWAIVAHASFAAEVMKLGPGEDVNEYAFGAAMAQSDERIVLGTAYRDFEGKVYVYDASGALLDVVVDDDLVEPAIGFGQSVAVHGTRVVAGAPGIDDFPGAAFVLPGWPFDLEGVDGHGRLGAAVATGSVPAVPGIDVTFIGHPGPSGGGNAPGTVERVVHLGDQFLLSTTTIEAEDGSVGDRFGEWMTSDDDHVLVGALGGAYLFDWDGTAIGKLVPSGPASGRAIAIHGDLAVVGASNDDDMAMNAGAAYLFDVSDPARPVEIAKLFAPTPGEGERFGSSVAVWGDRVLIGAPRRNDLGRWSGAAYVFDVSNPAAPALVETLHGSDTGAGDQLGGAVSLRGTRALVNAPWHESSEEHGLGAVYVFSLVTCDGADLDGSGAVDFADLLAVLSAWGPCTACPADLDGNGAVDLQDLLVVLSRWGACT